MPTQNDDAAPQGFKVEVFKLVNRLKDRMGIRFKDQEEGYLAPEAIAEADGIIQNLCKDSPARISRLLSDLTAHWELMRSLPDGPERRKLSEVVMTIAHEIKDIGSMCGYTLVAYFAESLRDYIGQTVINIEAQKVIVQAHLDAMTVTSHKSLREDTTPEAEELKRIVKIATDKYS
jgi:hypothetical protein